MLLLGGRVEGKKAAPDSPLLCFWGPPVGPHPTPGTWLPKLAQGPLLEVSALAQLLLSALCLQPRVAPSALSSGWETPRTRLRRGIKCDTVCTLRAWKQDPSRRHEHFLPGVHLTGRGGVTLRWTGHRTAIISAMAPYCSHLQDRHVCS